MYIEEDVGRYTTLVSPAHTQCYTRCKSIHFGVVTKAKTTSISRIRS